MSDAAVQAQTEVRPVAKSGFAKENLRSFVDRIERLNEERDALTADIREVYSEAKGTGFDTKIMRQVVRIMPRAESLRAISDRDRNAEEAVDLSTVS